MSGVILKLLARRFPRNISRSALFAGVFPLCFALAPTAVLAQRPLGTDVSDYQPSVNWTTVKNAGVTFAWTKATEGTYYSNPYFGSQEAGAKSAGIYIGAYHYARPSVDTNLTGAFSADTEAAFFWSVASNYVKGAGTYLVPMLDWEDIYATNGYGGFRGFSTTFMSDWVNEWCNSVSNLARASGVTLKPIVYTGTWYSIPGGYPGLNSTVTGWPAWIADYNGENAQTGAPDSSYPWTTWTIWQYDDTNWSGGDADVFNGTAAGLASLVIGGVSAPAITAQPLWRAVDAGGTVTLAAAANGSPPLACQWTFAGAGIPGATNLTYTLTDAQAADAGDYTLIVTNAYGSATSNPSQLLVYPLQAVVFADNFDTNSAAQWTLNQSSSDAFVAFAFDYSALGIPSAPNSANGTTLGLQMKVNLTSGKCTALSLSPTDQSFAGDYRLHFDAWINVNGPFPGGGASSTEYLTAGVGTAGNRTEWTTNSDADGYYFSVDGDGGVSAASTTFGDYSAYAGKNWLPAASGSYPADSLDNANPYYTAAFPNGQAAPALQKTKYSQQTGNLASGTFGLAWHDVIVAHRGSSVDWVVDGIRLATIPGANYTASNVFVGFWDPFASVTDNTNLSLGLVDNVRVEVPAVAPLFTTNPLGQTVALGTNVLFTAAATGLPAPAYQWLFNGTNILGATNSCYALAFVAATNAGTYSVVATNLAGSALSSNALLSLQAPAAPQFQSITAAGGVLQITFTGDPYWNYAIETSTNLLTWTTLTNFTGTNGVFIFSPGSATAAPQQFFRASVGP
jgi:GH25 family lysozyme M1 (1,4-beta-N-acetylmuramidase)